MSKHVEMIIDYTVVGEDYKYNDNHGVLTRCGDCAYYRKDFDVPQCELGGFELGLIDPIPDDYCSRAERA
jgi:hypothetical protein